MNVSHKVSLVYQVYSFMEINILYKKGGASCKRQDMVKTIFSKFNHRVKGASYTMMWVSYTAKFAQYNMKCAIS